jgi:hypothetical protein
MWRALGILVYLMPVVAYGSDWTMGGRALDRNPVSPEKSPPTEWHTGDDKTPPKNIRWLAKVGTRAIGGPVVANGLVWVGTNNEEPLDPDVKGDRGVYACFRGSDGKFLYQYASPRLELDKMIADWPGSGSGGSPVTETDRVWFVTNRREVVCLDTKPLSDGRGPARVVWKYDLVNELGVFPNSPMIPSTNNVGSPAVYKDWLYVPTGNGVDVDHPGAKRVRAPKAPSFVCFDKSTGKVVWKDNSPGKEGYGGHTPARWSSKSAARPGSSTHKLTGGCGRSTQLPGRWSGSSTSTARGRSGIDWRKTAAGLKPSWLRTPFSPTEDYTSRPDESRSSPPVRVGCSALTRPRQVTSAPNWTTGRAAASRTRNRPCFGNSPARARRRGSCCVRLYRA